MTSLTEFFNKHEDDTLKGISHKNSIIKRNIIAHMAVNGECTLSELTKELHISVPTITKLVQELVDENIVTDLGKVETPGGRRPNIFGLDPHAWIDFRIHHNDTLRYRKVVAKARKAGRLLVATPPTTSTSCTT